MKRIISIIAMVFVLLLVGCSCDNGKVAYSLGDDATPVGRGARRGASCRVPQQLEDHYERKHQSMIDGQYFLAADHFFC